MFMLVDVRGTGLTGHEFMTLLYRSEGVSVIDGGAFGRETSGCVRLCFAADEGQLSDACGRIRRFVRSCQSGAARHG
jgi:aspartate/methionine/tyrosine aminotransferase